MSTETERLIRVETMVDNHGKTLDGMGTQLDRIEASVSGLKCGVHTEKFISLEEKLEANAKLIRWVIGIILAGGIGVGSLQIKPEQSPNPSHIEMKR